ncbi:MAG TPA: hypothetical protein VFZ21_31360 [Gemmatimonadaceae bacterium]|jgi:hypothetical protein|nr:hypothetical protein [Gemmatimonadaceae bacterium]
MHVTPLARSRRAAMVAALMLGTLAACGRGDNQNEATGDVTPGAAAPAPATPTISVAEIDLGRAVSNARITDRTDEFRATDTIYTSVRTTGASPSSTVMARWTFEDGQVVQESSQAIAPTGEAFTEFHISKPGGLPAGKYKVEVFLDSKSVGTKEFSVK